MTALRSDPRFKRVEVKKTEIVLRDGQPVGIAYQTEIGELAWNILDALFEDASEAIRATYKEPQK